MITLINVFTFILSLILLWWAIRLTKYPPAWNGEFLPPTGAYCFLDGEHVQVVTKSSNYIIFMNDDGYEICMLQSEAVGRMRPLSTRGKC